jgi:hypothetical protein
VHKPPPVGLASSMDRGGTDTAFPSRNNHPIRFPTTLHIRIYRLDCSQKAAANGRRCRLASCAMLLKKPPVSHVVIRVNPAFLPKRIPIWPPPYPSELAAYARWPMVGVRPETERWRRHVCS